MIFRGLRFGMLLQLSVGPVCLLVFRTSSSGGLPRSLSLVLAAALVDLLYIALAILGAAALLRLPNVQKGVKIAGGLILLLFGIQSSLNVFDVSILPALSLFSQVNTSSIFLQGLLLTASNPLTILFWGGVFSARAADEGWSRAQLLWFGTGCVLSTLLFLTAVALAGRAVGVFLPEAALQGLNVLVGAAIAFFGLRMLYKALRAPAA